MHGAVAEKIYRNSILELCNYLKDISISGCSLTFCDTCIVPPLLHGMLIQTDFTISGYREKHKFEVTKEIQRLLNWRVTGLYLKGECCKPVKITEITS